MFTRKISPYERLYFGGQKIVPPFVIQVFVEGIGEIELSQLESAIARASQACPGARLIAQGQLWKDSGKPPRIRVLSPKEWDGFHFDQLEALRECLDPVSGPTCEVLMLSGRKPTLIFRAFHGVMDGRGVLTWVREVFRALRGETLQSANSELTDVEWVAQLGGAKYKRKLQFQSDFPLKTPSQSDRKFFWKRRIIPGNHPALVAKIASELATHSQGEQSQFMVPVDLRRHDPSLVSTANLSLPIFLEVQKGEPWETLQERLLQQLTQNRELSLDGSEWLLSKMPIRGIEAFVQNAIRFQHWRKAYLASAILSHLGKINLAEFSDFRFKAETVYSLPVHVGFTPLSFVATECPTHVELTCSCSAGDQVEQELDTLLDQIVDNLAPVHPKHWPGFDTCREFPRDQTIAHLFQMQVQKTPHAVAINGMTYEEVNHSAQQVAHLLRSMGIGSGSIVGLLGDRTERTLIGLIGVLKVGAAYLPMDPQYPDERIQFMLEDAKVSVCLTQSSYLKRISSIFSKETIALDQLDLTTPGAPFELKVKSRDLVYVIYTSGSTGRPKGVQIEHRSLVNYITWATEAYQIDSRTRFALFTSLAFDLSATTLFLPLLNGGSVELFPEELSHLTLRKILETGTINALKLTPTHLDLLGRLGLFPKGIRTIVVGGEQLKGSVAAQAQSQFGPNCRIINEYGPTEATIGCMTYVYDQEKDQQLAVVPIGVPIDNTQILILDSEKKEVARGQVGEIFIGGECLARGYLNRDELTREKFILWNHGQRLYQTGDLARVLENGQLLYLGRMDDQLKIRGHRIEPGEIEAVLLRHPQIVQAAVIGRSNSEREAPHLYGYYVATAPVREGKIRAELEKKLPRYLVPDLLIQVEKIPMTVNGKVDVPALPSPRVSQSQNQTEWMRQDEIEIALSSIWAQILELDEKKFDLNSNFYELGGDSMKMIEMLSTVARTWGQNKDEEHFLRQIRPIVQNPTLENVCRTIRNQVFETTL